MPADAMNILVTGATGFLGSALCAHWSKSGYRVMALIRPTSSLDRLADCADRLELIVASDGDAAAKLSNTSPDVIAHTACAYGRDGETPLQLVDTNIRLGLLLLDIARRSTGAVTFLNAGTVLAETVSPYATSKQQFVDWGRWAAVEPRTPLRFVNLRLQHLYGSGDGPAKFSTHVIRSCMGGRPELALTAGEQKRDFIYVDDAVSALSAVLAHAHQLPSYDEIDVGSGEAPSVRTFVETVHRLTRSTTRLLFGELPYRPHEAMSCRADVTRLRALGWRPRFDLEKGLRKTIELEAMRP